MLFLLACLLAASLCLLCVVKVKINCSSFLTDRRKLLNNFFPQRAAMNLAFASLSAYFTCNPFCELTFFLSSFFCQSFSLKCFLALIKQKQRNDERDSRLTNKIGDNQLHAAHKSCCLLSQ